MKTVEMYTTPLCGFCHAAKRLLTTKGVSYVETDVSKHPEKRAEMMQRSDGARSVPQIFIGGEHIGGSDQLHDLAYSSELDAMLAE